MSHLRWERPRVSVLLPVRNGALLLREALESVLAQSYTNFDVLVIDDGSTDGSADIARSIGDPRVRVLASDRRGVSAALNVGLAAASGRYIARQDADDRSLPQRFQEQVAFLDANGSIDLVATRVRFMDDAGAPYRDSWTDAVDTQWDRALDPKRIAALLPLTCCLVHGSIMARREALVRVGGYREDLAVAQDYDLWLRLLPEHRFAKLPDRLYTFRVHAHQVSATAREAQTRVSIGTKLRYLRRVARLPAAPRATVMGAGRGAELYREALHEQGFLDVGDSGIWDVAVFTDFTTIEVDMARIDDLGGRGRSQRIGNFLVRRSAAA